MHILVWVIALSLAITRCAIAAAPPVYQLTTVAGSDLVGDGGQATTAQLAQPEGLAVDSAGNLYIADAANHRVRKVTADGTVSTLAGNGHPGFAGDGGPATSAQLNQPYDLALDSAGNLYIADFGNNRVRRIGADGNILTVAGNGQSGSAGDNGPATSAMLNGPRNVALDGAGNLYISEFNGHRVRRVSPGGIISTAAGIGIAGFNGDGGPAAAAQLAFPAGLGLDGMGNLYIVDSFNVRIRKVIAATGIITSVLTQQNFGAPNIQIAGLAADSAGDLYIPESFESFVWKLTPAGALTIVAGVPGTGAYTGDGQPALQTGLIRPVEVALDSTGNLFLSESRRVRMSAAVTTIIGTVAGDGTFGYAGDGGSPLMAVLNAPSGLAFNAGLLYVSDSGNQRVRAMTVGGTIATVAGNSTQTYAGDGLAAIFASLDNPNGLAFDPFGNLYIADAGNNRVRRVDPTGLITTFAGNGTVSGFGGEGNAATLTPVDMPEGVVADPMGNVYITDTAHNRVIQVDAAGNIHTIAGTGTAGFSDGGDGALPQVYNPSGVALDASGNLYIADTQNQCVRLLTLDGVMSAVAGTGVNGFSGDGGPAAIAQLSVPSAVAVDSAGNIYIADTGNNRVRIVTPDGNINTIAGTGDASYNGDSGAAADIALASPAGLALDGQGNLFVADSGNNRVRQLTPSQTVTQTPPPQAINVAVANGASLLPGPLAPGEIFTIFGQDLGPATAVTGMFNTPDQLSTTLGGVQVLLNGVAAPLFYVQANQINAQVPYEVAGLAAAQMQIIYQGTSIANMQVALTDASPALFTVDYGTGNAAVVNQDGTINSTENPAPQGSYVVLYATGPGQTDPAGVTGAGAQAPYPKPVLPVSLTFANIPVNVLFAGGAPGFVGLMQINAQVPMGYVPTGDLPVVLTVGSDQSQTGVTIAVK
ncbi:MAG TPA: hypothetical protein VMT86_21200 [Bryobacteraceae bacterium]|nr:hypothetical protein [Bryobacteraceae bacterium]